MYSHDIHDSSSKPHGLEVGCDTTAAAMTDKKTTRVVQLDCADVSNDDDDFEDIFQVTEEWRKQKEERDPYRIQALERETGFLANVLELRRAKGEHDGEIFQRLTREHERMVRRLANRKSSVLALDIKSKLHSSLGGPKNLQNRTVLSAFLRKAESPEGEQAPYLSHVDFANMGIAMLSAAGLPRWYKVELRKGVFSGKEMEKRRHAVLAERQLKAEEVKRWKEGEVEKTRRTKVERTMQLFRDQGLYPDNADEHYIIRELYMCDVLIRGLDDPLLETRVARRECRKLLLMIPEVRRSHQRLQNEEALIDGLMAIFGSSRTAEGGLEATGTGASGGV